MTGVEASPSPADDTSEQRRIRLRKREELNANAGAYPVAVPVDTTIPQVRERFDGLEAGAETGV